MSVNSQYNSRGLETNPRRRLLLALAAGVALAPMRARADFFGAIAGGFNAGMGRPVSRDKFESQQRRLATAEVDAGSREAEAFFAANGLSMNSDRFSRTAREADQREFQRAIAEIKRARLPRYLTFMQMAGVGESLAPSLLRLDETWFFDERLAEGWVYVPPKSAVKVRYAGYCLDQGIPAPSRDARLRLLPFSSVTDEKTAKAMRVLAYAGAQYTGVNAPLNRAGKTEIQALVWALRDMQAGATPKLSAAQRRALAAMDSEHFGQSDALEMIGWNLGEKVGKDVRRNFGRLADLSDMNAVGNRMDEITRGQGANEPPTGSPFTQLAPGVSVMSLGTAPLQGEAVIANDHARPLAMDLRTYTAEAATNTQRILISGVGNGLGGSMVDKNVLAAIEKDLTQLSLFAALDWFPKGIEQIGFSPKSTRLGQLANITPLLGNVLSAAEALSGYEWTEWNKDASERKQMGAGERILAIAGTVPGAGALAKVVGKGALNDLILKAGGLSDKFETARNLGEWAVSDTVWATITQANGSSSGGAETALKNSIEEMSPLAGSAIRALEGA